MAIDTASRTSATGLAEIAHYPGRLFILICNRYEGDALGTFQTVKTCSAPQATLGFGYDLLPGETEFDFLETSYALLRGAKGHSLAWHPLDALG